MEAVLREGLQEIRANPDILYSIFEEYDDAYLQRAYGKGHIKKIINYIKDQNFHIVQAWPRDDSDLPCVSINVFGSDEELNRDMFSDYVGEVSETIDPQQATTMFQPTSYTDGYIVVPLAVSLTSVIVGQIFVDSSDEEFEVLIVEDTATSKRIGIGTGETVDISADDCFVRGQLQERRRNTKQFALLERLVLGIHAIKDPKAVKYWYYIIMYILASKRDEFESSGYQLQVANASDFSRLIEMLPKEWYSRILNLSFRSWMSWPADYQTLATHQVSAVRVDKDVVAIPIESGKSIITTNGEPEEEEGGGRSGSGDYGDGRESL